MNLQPKHAKAIDAIQCLWATIPIENESERQHLIKIGVAFSEGLITESQIASALDTWKRNRIVNTIRSDVAYFLGSLRYEMQLGDDRNQFNQLVLKITVPLQVVCGLANLV